MNISCFKDEKLILKMTNEDDKSDNSIFTGNYKIDKDSLWLIFPDRTITFEIHFYGDDSFILTKTGKSLRLDKLIK